VWLHDLCKQSNYTGLSKGKNKENFSTKALLHEI
jgi:hypothetical protein